MHIAAIKKDCKPCEISQKFCQTHGFLKDHSSLLLPIHCKSTRFLPVLGDRLQQYTETPLRVVSVQLSQ